MTYLCSFCCVWVDDTGLLPRDPLRVEPLPCPCPPVPPSPSDPFPPGPGPRGGCWLPWFCGRAHWFAFFFGRFFFFLSLLGDDSFPDSPDTAERPDPARDDVLEESVDRLPVLYPWHHISSWCLLQEKRTSCVLFRKVEKHLMLRSHL